jgi:hypothetical protein
VPNFVEIGSLVSEIKHTDSASMAMQFVQRRHKIIIRIYLAQRAEKAWEFLVHSPAEWRAVLHYRTALENHWNGRHNSPHLRPVYTVPVTD